MISDLCIQTLTLTLTIPNTNLQLGVANGTDETDMMTKTYKNTALQQKQWMPHNAIALCNSAAWPLSLCKQACKMTDAMLYSCVFIHTVASILKKYGRLVLFVFKKNLFHLLHLCQRFYSSALLSSSWLSMLFI